MNEKKIKHQLRNFERAFTSYSGKEPLARFLTKYYKDNRQMGSSDRRMTSRLCYNVFRIGNLFSDRTLEDRVVLAEYLCEQQSDIVALLRPDLADSIEQETTIKLNVLGAELDELFPLLDELSEGLDRDLFLQSQLVQPDLFIRVKRGREKKVQEELARHGVPFELVAPQALALPNRTRLQDFSHIRQDFEVQDLSSQRTIEYIDIHKGEYWWDACAGSGGKALMLLDKYPGTRLLLSDIRLSILRNLHERFEEAKVSATYAQKIIDLTADVADVLGTQFFDGIILDVPCSGSGTWDRTPEMKLQFDTEKLAAFSTLQKQIVDNVLPHLKSGKSAVYITCSVYKKENEDIVDHLVAKHGLVVEQMQILKGYKTRADSMFIARLRKP